MTLDFVVSLILYRFLLKFLLIFRKLVRGAVVALETPFTSASIIFLSSFVSNFRLCSKIPSHLRLCPQRGKVWVTTSLFALDFDSVLLLATDSFTVSDFESFPSSSRSSMILSACCWLCSCLACCWLCSCLPAVGYALSILLIFPCCWVCSSRGPRTHVAFFLLTTGSLAVVLSLIPQASLCGSLRLRGSLLSPPTPLLGIKPLRDCCFAVGALAPRISGLQQRVPLTMRIGFSFARYFFFFPRSAEMHVSMFTGCVHPHKLRIFIALGTTIAYQISSPASLSRLVYIHSHCGELRSCVLLCCVSFTVALLLSCCVSWTAVRAPPHL